MREEVRVTAAGVPTQIGKYRVLRLLGSGGMGRVYLAQDPDIGRQVAIKRVTLGADPQARERFIREAQTMGRLNHPNIVTLLEYGVDADTPFLVLEFLSGEDLSQWMLRPQRLRDQFGVMLGVAEALAAAHRMGVLHRDLKPENVRVLEDGRCKLLDFGIAQSGGGQLTASGYFVGTPEFVAPEVMSGAAHTAAADIYAFGLLCYVLLCGDNPFRGDTVQATVARVIQREVPRLDKRLGGLPAGLADLVHACLAKQPELRPADAAQLIASLRQIRAGVAADATLRELPQAGDTAPQPLPAPARTRASIAVKASPARPQAAQRWPWLALVLAGVAGWWLLQPPPAPTPTHGTRGEPATAPDSIATAPAVPAQPLPLPDAGTQVEPLAEEPATPPSEERGPAVKPSQAATSAVKPETEPKPRPEPPAPVAVASATTPATTPTDDTPPLVPEPQLAQPAQVTPTEPVAPQTAATASEPAPAPVSTPTLIDLRIDRVTPRVLRAGRSASVRIEGGGLAAVTGMVIASGGAADARFRVGELRHEGDGALEFTLNVARGVPLGSYAVLLQGEGLRHPPILLEISL